MGLVISGSSLPKWIERSLGFLKGAAFPDRTDQSHAAKRRWRLWQVETSIDCNLNCIMCPWHQARRQRIKSGLMSENIWAALKPYLAETQSIDFSGGGEPMLHPRLAEWVQEASEAGCRTGFLTNGVLLTPEKCRQFIHAGIDWIGVSMDVRHSLLACERLR
jgi:MoaA/NifB/PqqE/SkfB family radical SAM enzyme